MSKSEKSETLKKYDQLKAMMEEELQRLRTAIEKGQVKTLDELFPPSGRPKPTSNKKGE